MHRSMHVLNYDSNLWELELRILSVYSFPSLTETTSHVCDHEFCDDST